MREEASLANAAGARPALRLVSTLAARRALQAILAEGDAVVGHRATASYGAGSVLLRSLTASSGELFIGPAPLTRQLLEQDVLLRGSATDLLQSPTAMAIPRHMPAPGLPDRDALRAFLLGARAVCISAAESGRHFLQMAGQLGIEAQMAARAVRPEPGELVGDVLRRGQAEVGFQQRAELLEFEDLRILEMPGEFNSRITYQSARFASANAHAAMAAWERHLRSPGLRGTWQRMGLEPVAGPP